jgi:hypothetical protein
MIRRVTNNSTQSSERFALCLGCGRDHHFIVGVSALRADAGLGRAEGAGAAARQLGRRFRRHKVGLSVIIVIVRGS